MVGNQLNPDLDSETKSESKKEVSIRPFHTSNKMLVAVLEFVWIWLIPTALPKPSLPSLQRLCTDPFDLYKRLVQKVRVEQRVLNMSIRDNISAIRKGQGKITYLRRFIAEYIANSRIRTPNGFAATLDRLNQDIFLHKEGMNRVKAKIKVTTVEYNLLNQDIATVKLLKDLRACCYGIQNNMFV